MLVFKINYFLITIILFLLEVLIAIFIKDEFVRPYVGDFLVVILIYCFARTFFKWTIHKAAVIVLLFSFAIEFTQYLNFIRLLGWQDSQLAKAILGSSFAWADMIAYILGILSVLIFEQLNQPKNRQLPA